jgi:glyoxylase-like metal-dependent hydrolase (beta-lactamase superfamily II)
MRTVSLALLVAAALPAAARAQAGLDTVRIRTVPVAAGVYMLQGSGGNIGVSVGADAVFLVDDQFAPLSDRIVAAVRTITERPIRFLVNTHWHGDHTGGNENFAKAGVVIVAHDNVRQRMSVEQFMARFNRRVPPSPRGALPVITFPALVTFHLNDDEIHVVHVPHAHTDGDALVHWAKANVMHMGDTFFNGGYPFIDLSSGGSIDGLIEALNGALTYVNETTKIIPGHGPLAGRAELVAFRDVVVGARDAVRALIADGRDLDAILAARPTARWDEQWGRGFIDGEAFVRTIYESLTKRP